MKTNPQKEVEKECPACKSLYFGEHFCPHYVPKTISGSDNMICKCGHIKDGHAGNCRAYTYCTCKVFSPRKEEEKREDVMETVQVLRVIKNGETVGIWDGDKYFTPSPSEPKEAPEADFLQVGRAIECGHCQPEKYGEGLKQAEKAIPNYKCDCVCHDKGKEAPSEGRGIVQCEECGAKMPDDQKEIHDKHFCHADPTPSPNTEDWKKEFPDEQLIKNLKSFICRLLESSRAKERERIVGWLNAPRNSRVDEAEKWLPNMLVVDKRALLEFINPLEGGKETKDPNQ